MDNMKRLHVVGCPRSGTTLVMELVSTCFQNNGFCEHEMSIFKDPEGGDVPELFFSKQPSDIKCIERIFKLDERLFVICLMRDPRAVITSIHKSMPGIYFCNFRIWKICDDSLRRLCRHPRFFLIRYENLVNKADAVQQQLMEKFPFLEKKHSFSGYERFARPSSKSIKAMNGLRGVSSDRIQGWEKHLRRIKSQLEKHPEMVDILIQYSYEQDDSWTAILKNVTPAEYNCRYPDTESPVKAIETKFRTWRKSRRYISRHNLKN